MQIIVCLVSLVTHQPGDMIPASFSKGERQETCQVGFTAVHIEIAHNTILGQPSLNKFWAIVSSTRIGVITLHGDLEAGRHGELKCNFSTKGLIGRTS